MTPPLSRTGRTVLGRIALLAASLAVALLAAEAGVRQFRPQVTPASFEQRYTVDGASSYAPGYFALQDPLLPQTLRPGYDHVVADVAWTPIPFRVSLDRYGYRNPTTRQKPSEIAVIGDSVVFGFGVDAEDALPGALERLMGAPVDNLGIPNAGPETYPIVLDRYLNRPNRPRLVILVIYAGNDFQNIKDSEWSEIQACRLPASRVYRRDIAPFAPNYPTWMMTSPLKRSHLATLLSASLTSPRVGDTWQKARVHRLAALAAIDSLHVLSPTADEKKENVMQAHLYAAQIARQTCTSEDDRAGLRANGEALDDGQYDRASAIAKDIVNKLLARGCAEVDPSTMINPVPPFNFYGGYSWRRLAERAEGAITQYGILVTRMAADSPFSQFRERLLALAPPLRQRDRKAEPEIKNVVAAIDQAFPSPFAPPPASCDPMMLSIRGIRDLAAANGVKLQVVYTVSEAQLGYLAPGGFTEGTQFCGGLERESVPCTNLGPILTKASMAGGPALYVDGSHFTAAGNRVAAQQLADVVRKTRVASSR